MAPRRSTLYVEVEGGKGGGVVEKGGLVMRG